MSEYQYYEFLAIDRPLDDVEQAAIRSLSTRATITATSFMNDYHWGDFKGDPNWLMERYYDAHLYVADWGTRRVMFRLPSDLLDPAVVEDYCVGDQMSAWTTDEYIVLDAISEDHPNDVDYDAETMLTAIVGVRAELAAGDLRPLYIAWLAAYGTWERDEDAFTRDADNDLEPPVPPGLGDLTTAQRALADFLRLDRTLLAVAAQASPPPHDPRDLAAHLATLPTSKKDQLLTQLLQGEAAQARNSLQHLLHHQAAPTSPTPTRRTVGTLLDTAAHHRISH
ncbi:hypothetical protein [Actinokineospora diospyrosa]|uniref:hypothetical protein n=1 Tax=Actinokineospora diospyrosa TaxID=103728 RepID=UPI0020A53968|nr:hypothetical protein [Actinokineospora diospyrosa]